MALSDKERAFVDAAVGRGISMHEALNKVKERREVVTIGKGEPPTPYASSAEQPSLRLLMKQSRENLAEDIDPRYRGLGGTLDREGDIPTNILKFAAEAYGFGKFGRAGEAVGGQILRRLPALGKFLGRATGFGTFSAGTQAAEGETPTVGKTATDVGLALGTEKFLEAFGAASARAGKVPREAVRETMDQPTLGRVREMFGGVKGEELLGEAERVGKGITAAMRRKSPGRREAERMIKVADQMVGPNAIDSAPIKDKIRSLVDPNAVLPPRQANNEMLESLAGDIPDRLSFDRLDRLIRELSEPIKKQIGGIESQLPVQQRKSILEAAKQYRDSLLPGAVQPFKQASEYIGATKELHRRMFDTRGRMKTGAPEVWRQSFSKPVVQDALKEFDRATAGKYGAYETGRRLARKGMWTPDDGETAEGMLLAGIGWFGRATMFLSRGTGKAAIAASRPAGTAAAQARRSFESAFNPEEQPAP